MQRAQHAFQHYQQGVTRRCGSDDVFTIQCRLGQFEEPVAQLIPSELVQRLREVIEAIAGEVLFDLAQRLLEAGENPALGLSYWRTRRRGNLAFG